MYPPDSGRDPRGGYPPRVPHGRPPQGSPQQPERRGGGTGKAAAVALGIVGFAGTWLALILIAILLGRFDDSLTILIAGLLLLVGIGLLVVPNRVVKGLGLGLVGGGLTFGVFALLTLRGG